LGEKVDKKEELKAPKRLYLLPGIVFVPCKLHRDIQILVVKIIFRGYLEKKHHLTTLIAAG
jgi:hypothetical protein